MAANLMIPKGRFLAHRSRQGVKMSKDQATASAKSRTSKDAADKLVRRIKFQTCKQYSAEHEIRIVPADLRAGGSIATLCRSEEISEGLRTTRGRTNASKYANSAFLSM